MNICHSCQQAGDWNSVREYTTATRLHLLCSSEDCFCQHGVGAQWVQGAAEA